MIHRSLQLTRNLILFGLTSNSNEKVPSINLKYRYITLFMCHFIYSRKLNYIKPIDLQDFVNVVNVQQRNLIENTVNSYCTWKITRVKYLNPPLLMKLSSASLGFWRMQRCTCQQHGRYCYLNTPLCCLWFPQINDESKNYSIVGKTVN